MLLPKLSLLMIDEFTIPLWKLDQLYVLFPAKIDERDTKKQQLFSLGYAGFLVVLILNIKLKTAK
jgi:hypothetical protein